MFHRAGREIVVIVVDYGMGNLRSVANALEALGAAVEISARPQDLVDAARIILPGVGAFGEAMQRLRDGGFLPVLDDAVNVCRKPFLGICLGMELLAGRSFEHGVHDGLGWIPGEVRLIEPPDPSLRVPHIGWNGVRSVAPSPLMEGIPGGNEPAFYFVHSFHFCPADRSAIVGVTDYGGELVAVVARDHVFGTQFHPEKSHHAGLALLKNFLAYPA